MGHIVDRCNPRSGYFPSSYVQLISHDHTFTTTVLSPRTSTAPTDSIFQASMNSTLSTSSKGTEAEDISLTMRAKIEITATSTRIPRNVATVVIGAGATAKAKAGATAGATSSANTKIPIELNLVQMQLS